jgi:hypothetical protein
MVLNVELVLTGYLDGMGTHHARGHVHVVGRTHGAHSCERKNVFRGKLAFWNLEFCSSCVVLLRNVQVPRRNSDSHLVFRDPTQLRAKKRI